MYRSSDVIACTTSRVQKFSPYICRATRKHSSYRALDVPVHLLGSSVLLGNVARCNSNMIPFASSSYASLIYSLSPVQPDLLHQTIGSPFDQMHMPLQPLYRITVCLHMARVDVPRRFLNVCDEVHAPRDCRNFHFRSVGVIYSTGARLQGCRYRIHVFVIMLST